MTIPTQDVRSALRSRAVVLMYHRVAEPISDPWGLCVTPEHFGEQLEVLRARARVIGLADLIQGGVDAGSAAPSVVLTFDDGYADNLFNGKPWLERYDVPATLFVTTGLLGRRGEFWWDELEWLVLQPGQLPDRLHLQINGSTHEWCLGAAADYDEENYRRYRAWKMWQEPPTTRQAVYRALWQLLQPLSERDRRQTLDLLYAWAESPPACRQSHRILYPEELVALSDGLIEIGCHTATHPVLSGLPGVAQREEILASRAALEQILGRPVTNFAYPYGARSNYTSETLAILEGAGFESACASFAGAVTDSSDRFQLPRIQVQDWDGEEFARRLADWSAA